MDKTSVGPVLYLPELAYVEAPNGFPLKHAARVTARGGARWATREGELVGDDGDRQRQIDDIYDWFDADMPDAEMFAYGMALRLTDGESKILDQSEGFPGYLVLTEQQFRILQRDWSAAGLPPDLYYPATEQRITIEPVELEGGVVLRREFYSPRKWETAVNAGLTRRPVPSKIERDALFAAECQLFEDALERRWYELQEPDKERDREQMRLMSHLRDRLRRLRDYLSNPPEPEANDDMPRWP